MKRRYMFLEFLQSNDGMMYVMMYDLEKGRCLNFKFWEWLENLPDIHKIVYENHDRDCEDCPYREEDDDE